MEDHISFLQKFCRFCDKKCDKSYTILNLSEEVNYAYSAENVEISQDDPRCQSSKCCQTCYRNLKKISDKIKHYKKNPSSSLVFSYKMPAYSENVKVH